MALLFKLEGYKVSPYPEALLIPPFKEIWERDKSKNKKKALQDFTYIEFMSSLKKSNPFRHLDYEVRHMQVVRKALKNSRYKPDELVKEAIQLMDEFQKEYSLTYGLLKDASIAARKLSKFLSEVDFSERTKAGLPVWKPQNVKKMIDEISDTIKRLKEMEDIVFDELNKGFRIKGDKKISYFADPENLD